MYQFLGYTGATCAKIREKLISIVRNLAELGLSTKRMLITFLAIDITAPSNKIKAC